MSSKAYIVENGLVVRNGNITFSNTSGEAGTFILPAYTTTERNSLAGVQAQSLIYNTDDKEIQMYDGTGWLTNIETDIVFPQVSAGNMASMSPVSGLSVFNTTSGVLQMYDGTSWINAGDDGLVVLPQVSAGNMASMSPVSGLSVYNTTSSIMQMYNGSSWVNVGEDGLVIFPELTTAEISALTPVSGESVYNTTEEILQVYNGSAWVDSSNALPAYNHYFTIDVSGEGDFATIRSGVAAINAAGDNTEDNSYALILKPGTHVIDVTSVGSVTLPNWTYIIGDSPSTTTIKNNVTAAYGFTELENFNITGNNGFYNLELKGNSESGGSFASILYDNGANLILDNCTFRPNYNDTNRVLAGTGWLTLGSLEINNCNFDKNITGTSVQGMILDVENCSNVFIKNSKFNSFSGAICTFSNATGVVENCRFYNSSTIASNAWGIKLNGSTNFLIENSSFDKLGTCIYDMSAGVNNINNCLYTTTATSSRFFLQNTVATSDIKINNCVYPVSAINDDSGNIYTSNLNYGDTTLITATGDITLTNEYNKILVIDPNGSDRDITLPASSTSFNGETFVIINDSTGADSLNIKNIEGIVYEKLSKQQGIEVIFYNGKWYTKQYINSSNSNSIRIGGGSYAYDNAIAFGEGNCYASGGSISVGAQAFSNVGGIGIGYKAKAEADGISIGTASTSDNSSISIGNGTSALLPGCLAIGRSSVTKSTNEHNYNIGDNGSYSNVTYKLWHNNLYKVDTKLYSDPDGSYTIINPNAKGVDYGIWQLSSKILISLYGDSGTLYAMWTGDLYMYGDGGGTTITVHEDIARVTCAGAIFGATAGIVTIPNEGFEVQIDPDIGNEISSVVCMARLDGVLYRG